MSTTELAYDIPALPRLSAPATPANVVARLHHTRWADSSFSFTHSTSMRLDTLDGEAAQRVIRTVFQQQGLDVSGCQVLSLDFAQHTDDALTPVTAFWCLDVEGRLLAALVDVSITGEGVQLCSINPQQFRDGTLSGSITVHAGGADVQGRAHLALSTDRVAVGVQIPVEGTPVLTASVTGDFLPERQQEPRRTTARRERFSALRLVR